MSKTKELKEIPITQIVSESDRKYGGNGNIDVLAESMKKVGLIHAILVRKTESNTYMLIAGRRRLEAAKLLGWDKIRADVLEGELPEYDDEMALAENVNRQEMHPLDEAAHFRNLLDGGTDIQEIAKMYDRSVSGIYQRTRLMSLIEPLKQMFRDRKFNLVSAAAIAAFDENTQKLFYEENKNKTEIYRWSIIDFIRKANLLPLSGIADNQCADCKRRTFYENPELFEDYSSIKDVCFDWDCYSKKWSKLLAEKVENAKKASPETPDILILRCQIPFIGKRDKTVQIAGAEYSIKNNNDVYWIGGQDDEDEIDPSEIFTAFLVEIDCDELTVESREFVDIKAHEKRADPDAPKSEFCVDKLVDIPEEQIEKTDEALKNKYEYSFKFEDAVKEKFLDLVVRKNAGNTQTDGFTDQYLSRTLNIGQKDKRKKLVYQLYTGKEFDGSYQAAKELPLERLLALLEACDFSGFNAPRIHAMANPTTDEDSFAASKLFQFSGMTVDEYTELYKSVVSELTDEATREAEEAAKEETDENRQ
jgi:ParB/RepB/Spo0J family partition protein